MNSTTTSASPPTTHTAVRSGRDERMLRSVLATNATTSALGGVVAAVAATWLDDTVLDTGHPGWVRVVGAGLVVFGAVVALVSRTAAEVLPGRARLVGVADAGWVAFTLVTILAGWYSITGAKAMAAVGAMVAVFGLEQVFLARRLSRPAAR